MYFAQLLASVLGPLSLAVFLGFVIAVNRRGLSAEKPDIHVSPQQNRSIEALPQAAE